MELQAPVYPPARMFRRAHAQVDKIRPPVQRVQFVIPQQLRLAHAAIRHFVERYQFVNFIGANRWPGLLWLRGWRWRDTFLTLI